MTTYKAFNSMLSEFFGDLAETFDEYQSISDARTLLSGLLSVNEETDVPMKTFIGVFSPHKDLLMAKDKKLFDVCKIPMVSESEFDISKEWGSLDDDNQEAIWGYLHQLFLIGSTVMSLDSNLISKIEAVAQGCMSKVESGEMSEEDAKNPMVIVQEILKDEDLVAAFKDSGMGSMDSMGSMGSMDTIMQMMNGLGK